MKDFLMDVIKEAGECTLEFRKNLGSLDVEKKSKKDLVTEADKATEDLIRQRISERYPSHGILGEEGGEVGSSAERWIVDPIDGTASFVHGQPYYSVSMAFEKDGEVLLGAVYAPALDELYVAEKGKGAFLNGVAITKSPTRDLEQAIMATGFACLRSELPRTNLPYLNALLPQMRDMRRLGSAALDLCYVAAGRLEGFWELNLNLYDVAAGMLVVEEVGGKCTDFSGAPVSDCMEILVTNALIHDRVVDIFKGVMEQEGHG
jgi:myo-inositol-1(or 4)-monophosphatase